VHLGTWLALVGVHSQLCQVSVNLDKQKSIFVEDFHVINKGQLVIIHVVFKVSAHDEVIVYHKTTRPTMAMSSMISIYQMYMMTPNLAMHLSHLLKVLLRVDRGPQDILAKLP